VGPVGVRLANATDGPAGAVVGGNVGTGGGGLVAAGAVGAGAVVAGGRVVAGAVVVVVGGAGAGVTRTANERDDATSPAVVVSVTVTV
jgi:hypothetical protein